MLSRLLTLPSLLVLALLLPAQDATSPDAHWTQWRGPSGQGHSNDTRVPLSWSETENVLWKSKLPGKGNSTPIIWGDRIFLTSAGEKTGDRFVFCLDARDGKLLWQQTATSDAPMERTHGWNGFASPSCVTDGSHVWAFFGSAGLFCYDFQGKLVWKHDFGTFVSQTGWGTAASPFLYQDLIIQNCDNDGGPKSAPAALVALDRKTGEVRWSTPRKQGRGFSTPRMMKMADGRLDLVLNGPMGVWGYDPKTGAERWMCRRGDGERAKFGEPMPVDDGQRILILSGRNGPYQVLRMPGEGDVTASHVLHTGVRAKHRDVSSPILLQGLAYTADTSGMLSCYDLASGKELYSGYLASRSARSLASPILVRGKLLWLLDEGTTVVVEPSASKLQIVGRNKLEGGSLDFGASPAVANGRLYLRSQSNLYCIGEKK